MLSFPVTSGSGIREGEPVAVAAAGTLSEATDDPSTVDGIAAHAVRDVDGVRFDAGTQVAVYAVDPDQIFRTENFATDGGGTAATPTATRVGELAGLTLSGADWSLDVGTANLICQIVGVLDSNGRNLSDPNLLPGTGQTVLFRFKL